mgnify:FL=1
MRTLGFDKARQSRDAGRRLCRRPEGMSCAAANQSLALAIQPGLRPGGIVKSFLQITLSGSDCFLSHPDGRDQVI